MQHFALVRYTEDLEAKGLWNSIALLCSLLNCLQTEAIKRVSPIYDYRRPVHTLIYIRSPRLFAIIYQFEICTTSLTFYLYLTREFISKRETVGCLNIACGLATIEEKKVRLSDRTIIECNQIMHTKNQQKQHMLEMHLTELTIGFGDRLEPASKVLNPNLNSLLRDPDFH